MKIVTKEEVIKWLEERKFSVIEDDILIPEQFKFISCSIPVDTGIKTKLSRVLSSLFEFEEDSLMWVNEFGIWPSCEDLVLFYGFRKFLGEDKKIYEKPGHIFNRKDINVLNSILTMTLYFFWGAVIISANLKLIVKISHDEMIDIYYSDDKILSSDTINVIERMCKKD